MKKTNRQVEPLQLWFKEKTWYLRAFCIDKQDIRIFKLTRMKNLQLIEEFFERTVTTGFQEVLNYVPHTNMVDLILRIDVVTGLPCF